jgi:ppGpp synthetase/RelA/SpoT-type nucleotidyltranferase
MAAPKWTEPAYSRQRVNDAGKTYIDQKASVEDRAVALAVINNWRSSHSFPLNTMQASLRRAARDRDADPTVAQRIKRLPSIRHKLERMPGMKLSRMHDLGGARAVLTSADAVDSLVSYYINESQIKHRLVRHDPYIECPKSSGYRGVHLVYYI